MTDELWNCRFKAKRETFASFHKYKKNGRTWINKSILLIIASSRSFWMLFNLLIDSQWFSIKDSLLCCFQDRQEMKWNVRKNVNNELWALKFSGILSTWQKNLDFLSYELSPLKRPNGTHFLRTHSHDTRSLNGYCFAVHSNVIQLWSDIAANKNDLINWTETKYVLRKRTREEYTLKNMFYIFYS